MRAHEVTGHTAPTTPPSTPLDTLKALTLRNIDRLDHVIDALAGGPAEVPEELLDFIDGIKRAQFEALAEHVPVARDDRLDELRHIHPDGYQYSDGSPVIERWTGQYGEMDFYPRYDGDRATRYRGYLAWVAANRARAEGDARFGEIIDGIDWGTNGPSES